MCEEDGMEKWKECKLGDILADKGYIRGPFGSALKRGDMKSEGIPVYEQQHAIYQMREFRFFIDEKKFQEMKRFQVQENDLVISCSGTVGKVTIISKDDPKGIISQALLILRVKPNIILPKYLQYFFISSKGYNSIISRSSGSVQVNIAKRDVIESIPLSLPPLPTQQKIAAILSSLDDKIELNYKINTNLERQAQALFKNWFVDFEPFGGKMPEGWKEKPLYDYADFINGTSFKEDEYDTKGVPIIKIAELKNGITDATQYFNGEKDPKYDVKNGDILFSWSGNPETSIDIFIWSLGDGILNQHTFNVKSNTDRKWFTYCLLKYFKPEFCHRASCKQTTGLGHVTANDLKQITFSSGEKAESDFENLIAPIMKQIFNNKLENQKLVNIRDTLLPKLMNGEFVI